MSILQALCRAAVGLVFLRAAKAGPVGEPQGAGMDLRAYLASLDHGEFVDLLDEAAGSDPDLRRRLNLRAARIDGGASQTSRRFALANHVWPELAIQDYTQPLGDAGIAYYATCLREAGSAPNRDGWLIQHLREDLAEAQKDTDAFVEALTPDLTHGYAYLRIADALTAAGRDAEALTWVERGFAEHPEDSRLADHLTGQYTAAGRHSDALKIRWDQFRHQLGVPSHRQLLKVAEATGEADHYRDRALQALCDAAEQRRTRIQAARALIDILLTEDRFAEAWQAAETLGATRAQWLHLADACRTTRPEDALTIYLREATELIKTTTKHAYAQTADLPGPPATPPKQPTASPNGK
ncbi:hypothetical protein OG948_23945 [Embleya sp. NBC_00888]|uniref:hypothetical protein n=1 Tax=Embleya sp. NBC_00888 TaxID=2975960 RepID=UPI003863C819|nr:hypothetical protein OG948_23945 [Embleya sp. NBC_00888]